MGKLPTSKRTTLRWQVLLGAVTASMAFALALPALAADRAALLVGVGSYTVVSKLDGPQHDVREMKSVLLRRWGFRETDIVTLVDQQATKVAIMAQLRSLKGRTKPGDEVLIYLSGHGTSAANSSEGYPLPHGSGAFMPVEFNSKLPNPVAGLIVGRTDLRPVIQDLEQAGRKVWFITDSCFSGNQSRSLAVKQTLTARMIPLANVDEGKRAQADRDKVSTVRTEPYPYRNTVSLAASSEGEVAQDIPASLLEKFPTASGKAHGAFTDALLRVLDGKLPADANGDGQLDLTEIQAAVNGFMNSRPYGHASQRGPAVIEDTAGLGRQVFFAKAGAVAATAPISQTLRSLRVATFEAQPEAVLTTAMKRAATLPAVQVTGRSDADFLVSMEGSKLVVMTSGADKLKEFGRDDVDGVVRKISQLAWANTVWQLAERNRRGVLQWGYDPDQKGGNFSIGDTIRFVARSDRKAWLVVLNIDSDGAVTVLYPGAGQIAEREPLAANMSTIIPQGAPIAVQEPQGIDIQIAMAFDEPPPVLQRLAGLKVADARVSSLQQLIDLLETGRGKFTAARSDLRTGPRRQ